MPFGVKSIFVFFQNILQCLIQIDVGAIRDRNKRKQNVAEF